MAQAAEAAGATDATAHATTVAGAESGGDVAAGARVLALDATAVLRLHNRYRAMHAAPPLSWGGDLAGSAARYAAKVRRCPTLRAAQAPRVPWRCVVTGGAPGPAHLPFTPDAPCPPPPLTPPEVCVEAQ